MIQQRIKMKAIICNGPDQPLMVTETSRPDPGEGEVLVRLKAASINRRDLLIRKGNYVNLKYPIIPGSDGAGIIEKAGKGVNPHAIGDEVIINPGIDWGNNPKFPGTGFKILGLPDNGTYAEYVIVPASSIFKKPSHLTFEEAAALPLTGMTAYRALVTRANVQRGDKLLITGIGGGVAIMLLKLAVVLGAEVYVTSGDDSKIKKAIELGAVGAANYKESGWSEKLKQLTGGFDHIIDSAAGDNFPKLLDLAKPGGNLVFFGATAGSLPSMLPHTIYLKQLNLLGTTMGSNEDFKGMLSLVEQYKIRPTIDQVLPLDQVNEGFKKMEHAAQFGKIVLKIN